MDRSCKTCKWSKEKESLIGSVLWCGAKGEEVRLGGFCDNYQYSNNQK